MRGEAAVTSCGVCWAQGRKGGEYSGGREVRMTQGLWLTKKWYDCRGQSLSNEW